MTTLLFFAAVMLTALYIRRKRYIGLVGALPAALASFFLFQCVAIHMALPSHSRTAVAIAEGFIALPGALVILFCAVLGLAEAAALWRLAAMNRNRLPHVGQGGDGQFPSGICIYVPGGRIVMVNHVMEELCRRAAGECW